MTGYVDHAKLVTPDMVFNCLTDFPSKFTDSSIRAVNGYSIFNFRREEMPWGCILL